MTWKEAIVDVLKEAGTALSAREIAERIAVKGIKQTAGATPDATVGARLSTALKDVDSPFVKVGKGRYALVGGETPEITAAFPNPPEEVEPDAEAAPEHLAIRAYGVYWERDAVDWAKAVPKLLGQQFEQAKPVDFAPQRGVYLLHDGRETVYVGRTTDQGIAHRLREHSRNRLRSRWNRFSWFGLLPVADDGTVRADHEAVAGPSQLIAILEAVLIEVLEPGQNRQSGQTLGSSEYLQTEDPDLVEKRKKAMLLDLVLK
mgnify:CR=1 FL=1